MVGGGLRSDGAHGVGQRWISECGSGRAISDARLCRGHGGAHHLGSVGAGLRAVPGEAGRLSERADAAAQRGAEFYWRMPFVGRMVRL